jgi:predicted MFS family arabinose efflux permease
MWQFCTFAVIFAFFGVSTAIGPAYVVDANPHGNVGRDLSLFQSMFWIGSIAGMASTGYAVERLGIATTILVSIFFPMAAVILLLFAKEETRPSEASIA